MVFDLRALLVESRKWQAEGEYGDPLGPESWTPEYADYMKRLDAVIAGMPAKSETTPRFLVRAGGDNYSTWLCSSNEDVRKAISEALYGDAESADVTDIDNYMSELGRADGWDGAREMRWTFEDGWLEVIELEKP
jgi:hypothetical protein